MPRSSSPRRISRRQSASPASDDEDAALRHPLPTASNDSIPPAQPSSELMVTSRAKRSTAGNRLKALLDQELEKDEVFAEVENDIDFEANENEDGVDIVDSDFDRESDDDNAKGVGGEDDESEGEREIEAQEKMEKQKRREKARAVGIIKRPTAPTRTRPTAPSIAPKEAGEREREAKRRRISFAPDSEPSSSSRASPSTTKEGGRRSSARSATVQSKLQVESRLTEASQRRAALPTKAAPRKKESLTQDALIAEALEVEEENRESLRRFLEQEEERRAKQRQRKERIVGPFVRWMSVGLKTKVVEEVDDAEAEEGYREGAGQGCVRRRETGRARNKAWRGHGGCRDGRCWRPDKGLRNRKRVSWSIVCERGWVIIRDLWRWCKCRNGPNRHRRRLFSSKARLTSKRQSERAASVGS